MRYVHSGLATPAAAVEEDCRVAAGIGAEGLELAGGKLPALVDRAGASGLRDRLRRHGVRAVSIAVLEDVTFRDVAGLEALLADLHRWSELARTAGASWIVVTPGERPDGADDRDALREARSTLERLARVTERYDVGVALCPLGRERASLRGLRPALAVVEGLGRASVALAPDTFEMWAAGAAAEELKACHPRHLALVRAVGAADAVAPGEARAHHRREPGAGPVPVGAWLAVARALQPGVVATAPVPPPDGAEAEAWARRLRERVAAAARETAAGRA
jgi:sugar phosphate isomerase/epimerase